MKKLIIDILKLELAAEKMFVTSMKLINASDRIFYPEIEIKII